MRGRQRTIVWQLYKGHVEREYVVNQKIGEMEAQGYDLLTTNDIGEYIEYVFKERPAA